MGCFMNFKYILSILLVLSGVQFLVSSEEVPKVPELTFEQTYDQESERMTRSYGAAFREVFCKKLSPEETSKCYEASVSVLPLMFGRKESAIPYQHFQDRAEWEQWLQTQPKTLLMLTQQRCLGCAYVHGFLGNYVEKCRNKELSIVAMSSKDLANLEKQGIMDFKKMTGFPELFPIYNGKVASEKSIDPLKNIDDMSKLMTFLQNHCS